MLEFGLISIILIKNVADFLPYGQIFINLAEMTLNRLIYMMKPKIGYESPEIQRIYAPEDSIFCNSTGETTVDDMMVVNEEW